jgi:hypothetical protein
MQSNGFTLLIAGLAIFFGAATAFLFTERPDHEVLSAHTVSSPSPSSSNSPTPSASSAPSLAGLTIVKISLFDVRLGATDPIADLVYGSVKGSPNTVAFTTETLSAKYADCKAGALGTMTRSKATPTPTPRRTASPSASPRASASPGLSTTGFIKSIGGYDYYYHRPAFSCVTDRAGRDTVAAAKAALVNAALPTLQ